MGIDVYLEDENGKELESVMDEKNSFAHFITQTKFPDTMCLRFIDPYGDTTFNGLQLPVIEDELRKQLETTTVPLLKAHLQKIIDLVVKAQSDVHIYIKFFGD